MKKHRGKVALIALWGAVIFCCVFLAIWVERAAAIDDKPGPVFFGKEVSELVKDIPEESGNGYALEYEEEWCEPQEGWYPDEAYYVESGYSGGSPDDFQTAGVVYDEGTTYTWYSENVLPGGGLDIPGRSVNDDGYVVDGDGNLCVASSDYDKGTVLDTPFGQAVVYDSGCASGVVDVYTSW